MLFELPIVLSGNYFFILKIIPEICAKHNIHFSEYFYISDCYIRIMKSTALLE